jgi:hypothetical protein
MRYAVRIVRAKLSVVLLVASVACARMLGLESFADAPVLGAGGAGAAGGNGGCGASCIPCAVDADCSPGHVCEPETLHCVTELCLDGFKTGSETDADCGGPDCLPCGIGRTCASAADCESGHCVEGVCCDAPCDGVCASCLASLNFAVDGLCMPVGGALDPRDECEPDAASCAGAGCSGDAFACAPAPYGTTCGDDRVCDAQGSCKPGLGTPCVAHGECASGMCADGVCCDSICYWCAACNLPGLLGTCTAYPEGTDPDEDCEAGCCGGSGNCGMGNCSAEAPCQAPTDCISTSCSGGFCL